MRVRAAMVVALSLPMAGCSSTWNCKPDDRSFALDLDLTEADVTELLATFSAEDRAALECESVCSLLERDASGWSGEVTVDACGLTLSEPTGADPEEVVGSLSCSGTEGEYYCEGRRPQGHVHKSGGEGLAGYLSGAAHLEAASVLAFDELADQLCGWGAPEALVHRCRLAAKEERAHAVSVGGLALALGGAPLTPAREEVPTDLFSAALHNAVEGCVNESWAAVLAWWRSSHATQPALRQVYASLAADESRHAQLAWDLHLWMLGRLDDDQRQAVIQTQRQALARLPELASRQALALPAELGLSKPGQAALLARRFVGGMLAQA